MTVEQRSGCPINLALEVIGDKWSLLVVRDMMFGDRRHFRELLAGSEEGIASNVLADRLQRLTEAGLITRRPDPSHRQKVIYSLAEPAIQLVPVLAALGSWGRRHLRVAPELAIRAELLERGGPELWDAFMDELRALHLGEKRAPDARSVLAELTEAYRREVALAALAEPAARVAELARAVPPGAAPVVIGIDGPSGSGKSTLAEGVRRELSCPVVHMDDLFPGWDGLAQAAGLLTEQVLRPLAAGTDAGYRRWDWVASSWGERVDLPRTPLLIVEGCASTVGPAAEFIAVRVWVEADAGVRMTRGLERDGETFRPHWERWAAQERDLFATDGTRERADVVVRT